MSDLVEPDRFPDARRFVGRVVGRFAPSPSGPLHAGSLAAAMASWLDVRAAAGRWLVRIEDLDGPREVKGAADDILRTLQAYGFRWDGPVLRQSARGALYAQAFERLQRAGLVYPCGCSRKELGALSSADADGTLPAGPRGVYPGTCRAGLAPGRVARAWRIRVSDRNETFVDRAAGVVRQNLARDVGDFVVRRADGLWAYQLAVVVDDADQGVTDVVRGADLLDSTARQRLLHDVLGWSPPRTLHVPLVVDDEGIKLAKSRGAAPLDPADPLPALMAAARHLRLSVGSVDGLDDFWDRATVAWAAQWPPPGDP